MRLIDTEAQEAQAWQGFVQHLAAHLSGQWPAMPERLGERYPAFIELAVKSATEHGLNRAAAIARYVNLCFVWGAGFQDKPGFAWAKSLLERVTAQGSQEWLSVHQLVQRSLLELDRLPQARLDRQGLEHADSKVLERFAPYGRQGAIALPQLEVLPAKACDLEALELRLLESAEPWRSYQWLDERWQYLPLSACPPLRALPGQPLPAALHVLAPAAQGRSATRLQLRSRSHAACDGDVHPALAVFGPHGCWDWAGHEVRALNWPLRSRLAPPWPAGAGTLMAEETAAEYYRVQFDVCGLRDEGEAMGPQQSLLAAWPGEQTWIEIQRALPPPQTLWPGPRAWVPGSTRCRVEIDGQAQAESGLREQFKSGLDTAAAQGLAALAAAWAGLDGLQSPSAECQLGLLTGSLSATWGWQVQALDQAAWMRLLTQQMMNACQIDLQLAGEWHFGGARTRLTFSCQGQQALPEQWWRESPEVPLHDLLRSQVSRWRWPLQLLIEPVADDCAALLQLAAPLQAALVGEAGLRPCSRGRGGWEWFVGLRLEPVEAALRVTDPLLGEVLAQACLLPALTLVDWSMG